MNVHGGRPRDVLHEFGFFIDGSMGDRLHLTRVNGRKNSPFSPNATLP